MEENKKIEQPKRFSYEELESIASNLSGQVQHLSARLQEANMFNMFKRLDYCFKVLEVSSASPHFAPEFVEKCVKEIGELMTPPTTEPKDSEIKA